MSEKIVYDPKEDAKKKSISNEKPAKAAKSKEAPKVPEPVKEFAAKLNKYRFIHVPKRALPALPFAIETPLIARIDGDNVTISAATKKN